MPEATRAKRRLTAREFQSYPSNRWTELVRGEVRANVVEVLSPSDMESAVKEKIADYRAAGTRLIWIVDPERRLVTVIAGDASPRTIEETEVLYGEEVVPGFRCPVSALFEGLAPPES